MIQKKFNEQNSKNTLKTFFIVCISGICLMYAFFYYYNIPMNYAGLYAFVDEKIISNKQKISIGNTTVFVDIADTEAKRIQGLSGRDSLSTQDGMLFIFDDSVIIKMWMKNTLRCDQYDLSFIILHLQRVTYHL